MAPIIITKEEEAIKLTKELNQLKEMSPSLYFINTLLRYFQRIIEIETALKDWEHKKRILEQMLVIECDLKFLNA
jgi:hypothetical protein